MRKPNSGKALLGILQLICVLLITGCAVSQQPLKVQEIPVFPSPPDEARFFYERSIYTSADVVSEDKNANLRRLLTGEPRTGEGLGKPYGVAVYHGRVFVSDTALHYVAVFDIPNQRYFKIGEEEVGHIGVPVGLDVDGKGNLYVVDSAAKHVQVYDKDGRFLRTLAEAKMFSRPSGIAVDAEGSRIYVVDTGGIDNDNHRVRVFDAVSGKHLFDIGKRGSGDGEFNLPRDVSIGKEGLLYVVDGANFRVQVFKPDGTFVRVFGGIGRQGGQFSLPKLCLVLAMPANAGALPIAPSSAKTAMATPPVQRVFPFLNKVIFMISLPTFLDYRVIKTNFSDPDSYLHQQL